jgi:predicted  nucleic acid-binding Zn-ribbon protein
MSSNVVETAATDGGVDGGLSVEASAPCPIEGFAGEDGLARTGKRRSSPRRSSSADGVLAATPFEDKQNDAAGSYALQTISTLRAEINGMAVKHREEVYWLKLELGTTRREKEAIEDRISDLYRDMHELVAATVDRSPGSAAAAGRGGKVGHPRDLDGMQKQLQKYEKMVLIMNNQIGLLRSSTDSLLKSLKDEISDLVDDKSRTELNLMNRMEALDKENRELKLRLQISEQRQHQKPLSPSKSQDANATPVGRLASASHRQAGASSAEMKQLQEEIKSLRQQNRKKDQEISKSQDSISALEGEREELSQQVDKMRWELEAARSSDAAVRAQEQIQKDQQSSSELLDRVVAIWDQTHESIRRLSSVMEKLAPASTAAGAGDEARSEDADRALSVLETAALVQGQIKVSLMLVELQLRNNLACLRNDRAQLDALGGGEGGDDALDDAFEERLNHVQEEALGAVDELTCTLEDTIARLEAQSEKVTATLTESIESRIGELQRMQTRQTELYQMLSNLRASEEAETREVVNADGSVDVFVSRKVLESLQNEVLMVVDRVKEKNEEIVRLTATVDELKVRERAFMEELRRMMQEQSRIEMEERNRRMLAQQAQDALDGVDDDVTDSDYEDCSSSAYEESHAVEEVEEDEEFRAANEAKGEESQSEEEDDEE